MSRSSVLYHFFRFAIIGAIGTLVHFGVLVLLVNIGSLSPVFASQMGAIFGAAMNYLLNRKWNYGTTASHLETGPKFFTVVVAGFVLNGVLMFVFSEYFGWNYLWSQVLTTLLVLFWNFLANHFWTFTKDK